MFPRDRCRGWESPHSWSVFAINSPEQSDWIKGLDMGWVCGRDHLLRPSGSGSCSNFQEAPCRRLFRPAGLVAGPRQCHHMAGIRGRSVLHHEGIRWLGDAGCGFCSSLGKVFQGHAGRHHPLLYSTMVDQDIFSSLLPTPRQQRSRAEANLVACTWSYPRNVLRLHRVYPVSMSGLFV